jgi:hypothetical protein
VHRLLDLDPPPLDSDVDGGRFQLMGLADRLQEARPDLGPADWENRSNGIERRLAVLPSNERVRHGRRDHCGRRRGNHGTTGEVRFWY